MEQQIEIRSIAQNDLAAICRIHKLAFPHSAYSYLGLGCLYRYYDWLLNGPHHQLSEAIFVDDTLAGYCFSGKFKGATSGFLKNNKLYLVFRVLTKFYLVFDRNFRKKLNLASMIFRKLRKDKNYGIRGLQSPRYSLLAIAVDPNVHGKGLGKKLLVNAEREARNREFEEMILSVETDNEQAVGFYLKNGWEKLLDVDGWEGKMTKRIDNADDESNLSGSSQ